MERKRYARYPPPKLPVHRIHAQKDSGMAPALYKALIELSKESDVSNLANLTICKVTTNSRNPVPLLDVNPADAFINCRIRVKLWVFPDNVFRALRYSLSVSRFPGGRRPV